MHENHPKLVQKHPTHHAISQHPLLLSVRDESQTKDGIQWGKGSNWSSRSLGSPLGERTEMGRREEGEKFRHPSKRPGGSSHKTSLL